MLRYTSEEGDYLKPWPTGIPWPTYEDFCSKPIGFRQLMDDLHGAFLINGVMCHVVIASRGEGDEFEILWRWDAINGITDDVSREWTQ